MHATWTGEQGEESLHSVTYSHRYVRTWPGIRNTNRKLGKVISPFTMPIVSDASWALRLHPRLGYVCTTAAGSSVGWCRCLPHSLVRTRVGRCLTEDPALIIAQNMFFIHLWRLTFTSVFGYGVALSKLYFQRVEQGKLKVAPDNLNLTSRTGTMQFFQMSLSGVTAVNSYR